MDRTLQGKLVRDDLGQRDPAYVAVVLPALGRLMRLWCRYEVRGMERLPARGSALVVVHREGGLLALDVPILAAAFVEEFGPARPLYVHGNAALLDGPAGAYFRRSGLLDPTGDSTDAALAAGAVVIVPSDVPRAVAGGAPVVRVVCSGGHEARLGVPGAALVARVTRLPRLPRLTVPLPTRITARVLDPLDP